MGKTTYQKSWESRFKWVTGVNNNFSLAHCICWKTSLSIFASGISQPVISTIKVKNMLAKILVKYQTTKSSSMN